MDNCTNDGGYFFDELNKELYQCSEGELRSVQKLRESDIVKQETGDKKWIVQSVEKDVVKWGKDSVNVYEAKLVQRLNRYCL